MDEKIEELALLMKECKISREVALTVADYLPNEFYQEMIDYIKSSHIIMSDHIILLKLIEIKEWQKRYTKSD